MQAKFIAHTMSLRALESLTIVREGTLLLWLDEAWFGIFFPVLPFIWSSQVPWYGMLCE